MAFLFSSLGLVRLKSATRAFSALAVVPLVLIGFEALTNLRIEGRAQWMTKHRWPLRFFVGVCFWNLVGAGLLAS